MQDLAVVGAKAEEPHAAEARRRNDSVDFMLAMNNNDGGDNG